RRSVDVTGAVHDQTCFRVRSVWQGVQNGFGAVWADLEHCAGSLQAALVSRSIDVPGTVHNQSRHRVHAIRPTDERVQDGFHAGGGNLEHGPLSAYSPVVGRAIEIPSAIHDQIRL